MPSTGRTNELNGNGRVLVITPHPGEMARLAGCSIADVQKDRLGVARQFAREHELIVVLKGHRTLVVQPNGEAWVNTTGNPGMSTGGTGDILTGITAGMIAQHPNEALLAVIAAVHLARDCRRCDGGKCGRAFHGRHRPSARSAEGVSPRAAECTRRIRVLGLDNSAASTGSFQKRTRRLKLSRAVPIASTAQRTVARFLPMPPNAALRQGSRLPSHSSPAMTIHPAWLHRV